MSKNTGTRNTAFNYYVDNNTYMYTTSTTATASAKNITLLEYSDYIVKTGQDIIDDAKNNFNTPSGTGKFDGKINTDNLEETSNYKIYGSPHKMVLDNRQQYNNCGILSTLNTLVMAGLKTISNQNKTETSFTKQMWNLGIASDDGTIGKFGEDDGGTQPGDYKEIFEYYGINSTSYASPEMGGGSGGEAVSLDTIAQVVKSGGAAIIAVSSDYLWGRKGFDPDKTVLDHAILVTGVVCDDVDTVIGFYIHDTAMWMTRYISYDDLKLFTMSEVDDREWKHAEGIFGTIVEDSIKSKTNNLNLTGSKHDNILTGNDGNNTLKGLNGNDILYGLAGTDKIYGGNGNDTINGGSGDDKLYGDAGNDIIIGDDGNDTIKGGKGSDWIFANSGIIDFETKTTTEILNEIDALDETYSLVGRNIIYGDAGNDNIFGGNYNDLIYGGTGNDIIYGRNGIDVLYGGKGNDYLSGGDGADRILCEAGNDTIDGGKGDDVIICGSGKDRVLVNSEEGFDKISSSSGSVTFKIDKSAWLLNYSYDNAVKVFYNEYDGFEYQGFFNSKKNKYQTAYLEDTNYNTYRLSATKSSGNIKVANKNGNNLMFSTSTKNNNVTTSSYNDIIWLNGGNNTITYSGGIDKYFSSNGNDTYIVNNLTDMSYLSINDSLDLKNVSGTYENDGEGNLIYNDPTPSLNDTLKINTDKSNLRLFFDVQKTGNTSNIYDNLYIVTTDFYDFDNIFAENATGVVSIQDYFKSNVDFIDSEQYKGDGYIENIYANGEELNLVSTINAIQDSVVMWLQNPEHYYNDVQSALHDENVSDLLALYNVEINTPV